MHVVHVDGHSHWGMVDALRRTGERLMSACAGSPWHTSTSARASCSPSACRLCTLRAAVLSSARGRARARSGGHVAFLEGAWPFGRAWMDTVVTQFLDACLQGAAGLRPQPGGGAAGQAPAAARL